MTWKDKRITGIFLSMSLALFSCKKDPTQTKLTYMPDMADAPTVKPLQDYLEPPNDSMPVNAIVYPPDDQLEEWERVFTNPYKRMSASDRQDALVEGEQLYQMNCSTCHGAKGQGDSMIADKFPPPPDLTNEMYAERSDGFFFHKITVGGPIMPSRAEATFPLERWKIILHVRTFHSDTTSQGDHP